MDRFIKFSLPAISHAPGGHVFIRIKFLISYACRGSPSEYSCEVWLKLAQWYRKRCHLKQIVDDNAPWMPDIK